MFDTLIIGAGQAGLAAGYTLQRAGLHFALLEAESSPTGSWSQYYESLKLFSPARFSSLPGMPFPGDPERYPRRDEVIAYLQSYAEHFYLPVHFQARVQQVQRRDQHFCVKTTNCDQYEALSIIVATGAFHHPYVPHLVGQDLFHGQVLHSAAYKRPDAFHGQRIVVVGAGESALQIAVELADVARVTIASRNDIAFRPQRVLGRDIHFWSWLTGLDRLPLGDFWEKHAPTAVIDTGRYKPAFATGNLDRRPMFQRFTNEGVVWEDESQEAVESVIFATGYHHNLDFLSDLNTKGDVMQKHGINLNTPGVYYLGQEFQRTFASATLRGVGADARVILKHLQSYLQTIRPSSKTQETSTDGVSLLKSH